ncbi:MAG: extracellular solute-binding protein [Oscillospiraceae bacterium]|nr:extracellular solute-binding protein [Oscillospiraceae bacterium]
MKKGLLILLLIWLLFTEGCAPAARGAPLRVAIPESGHVQNPDTNYYVNWLEERTGLELEFVTVRQRGGEEYLDALLASDADVDAVLFGDGFTISEEALRRFAEAGELAVRDDGTFYYANYGDSVCNGPGQVLWINCEWLGALGLSIPRTTEELRAVLSAFQTRDPNGNGVADEIPLAGAADDYAYLPTELLLDAYVYNDPYHSRLISSGAGRETVAAEDAFREGLSFCAALYRDGLLDARVYERSLSQLAELVNSPEALVGAFTTDSISKVIYQGNPEIMARYMHVAPLKGPRGVQNALYVEREPSVGAIIPARSTRQDDARRLLDTMLSSEASLIARYGEQGVDWEFSDGSDVSIYGGASTIVTKNYIWNTPQNKHLNGIGPMRVREEYLEGVTWNGVNSDAEYIDARARTSYRPYLPETNAFAARNEAVSAYVDGYVRDFITGEREIGSDAEWNEYVSGLAALLRH